MSRSDEPLRAVRGLCNNLPGTSMINETRAIEPEANEARDRALERRRKALAICAAEPEASFENVWHALILLELSPLERLNWSLTRGRATTGRPNE